MTSPATNNPTTIRDLVQMCTLGRAEPEHFATYRLMCDGRRVTIAIGCDEGAVALMAAMEHTLAAGQTALDPRCEAPAEPYGESPGLEAAMDPAHVCKHERTILVVEKGRGTSRCLDCGWIA